MIRITFLFFLIYTICICSAEDEKKEPELKYFLEVNGKKQDVVLGKPFQITGTFTDPKAVLSVSQTRNFTFGGLSFLYPSNLKWEAEIEGENDKTWTLSGEDFLVIVMLSPEELTLNEFIDSLVLQYEKDSAKVSDCERTLGSQKYKGKTVSVHVKGIFIVQEVYILPAKSGVRIIIFQDSPEEKKISSPEGEKAMEVIVKNFKDTMAVEKEKAPENK